MRNVSLVLLATVSLNSCDHGHEADLIVGTKSEPAVVQAPPSPSVAFEGPHLEFFDLVHDFGKVSDTETLVHAFDFLNSGSAELVIEDVKASCGCTTPELPKRNFAPNEGAVIDVAWDPKGFGPQTQTVTLTTNSVPDRVVKLTIKADIKPFLRVTPSAMRFDAIRLGQEHKRNVTITCESPDFVIDGITSKNPHVTGRVIQPPRAGRAVIEVVIGAEARWGTMSGKLEIAARAEAGADVHVHDYTVGANLYRELIFDRPYFSVGRVAFGAPFRKEVTIKRPSGAPFSIVHAEVSNPKIPDLHVSFEPLVDGGAKLVLAGTGPSFETLLSGSSVQVATDVPGDELRTLPIMGVVGPVP